MLLAHALWDRTPPGATAAPEDAVAALDRVMRVDIADELEGTWVRLATPQQRVLAAVAENRSALYARETARRTGAGRGGSVQGCGRRARERRGDRPRPRNGDGLPVGRSPARAVDRGGPPLAAAPVTASVRSAHGVGSPP